MEGEVYPAVADIAAIAAIACCIVPTAAVVATVLLAAAVLSTVAALHQSLASTAKNITFIRNNMSSKYNRNFSFKLNVMSAG